MRGGGGAVLHAFFHVLCLRLESDCAGRGRERAAPRGGCLAGDLPACMELPPAAARGVVCTFAVLDGQAVRRVCREDQRMRVC